MSWIVKLETLSYKRKNQLLLLVGGIFIILTYRLAIHKTIGLYTGNQQLQARIANAANAPTSIVTLRQKLTAMNDRLGDSNADPTKTQELILETITTYCQTHGLTLKDYPDVTRSDQPFYQLQTRSIAIEGEFIPLLKLIDRLEHIRQIGRVASVQFLASFDHRRSKKVLVMLVYIQSITLKK